MDAAHPLAALRPFPVRDLIARRVAWRGAAAWVLHNPLSGRYARVHPRLHALLGRLDGSRSLAEALALLPPEAPGEPDAAELTSGVAGLLRLGLLRQAGGVLPPPPRPSPLRRMVYWPVDLGDLAPALPIARRILGPLFTPFGVLLWLGCLSLAVALWLPRRAEAEASFAALAQFVPLDALSLFLLFGLLKLVHELGHAVCAQRMAAAEGHQIGVFRWGLGFMFLLPAPWVDVTGTWFIASRWRRAAVGLAGIWVDLFLAGLATILWAFAEPGPMRELLFQAALVCGVSSLLFNANPLVRLDGYYVMCDLLEVSSVQARAMAALRGLGGALVGQGWPAWRGGDAAAALWGLASFAYRMLVFLGVFWLALSWHWLLGLAVASLVITLYLVLPALGLWRAAVRAGPRAAPLGLALGALGLGALLVPLPDSVTAEGVVERQGTTGIHVPADGQVMEVAASGPAAGALLLRLHSPETLRAIAQLEHEAAAMAIEARQASAAEPARIAGIAARQAALEAQLATLRAEIAAWTIRAPETPGLVWAAGRAASLPGAWVRRDDPRPLGHAIATEGDVVLRLVLGQRAGPLVLGVLQPGAEVPVRARGEGPAAFQARLAQIRPQARAELPSEALAQAAARAAGETAERIFEVNLVPPEGLLIPWRHGQRVEARLPLPPAPLAAQAWRRARQALEPRLAA